jgi:hypothetical protein
LLLLAVAIVGALDAFEDEDEMPEAAVTDELGAKLG